MAQLSDSVLSHVSVGTNDFGAPGYRHEYTQGYYAAFVRDLDGHEIEAMLIEEQRTA